MWDYRGRGTRGDGCVITSLHIAFQWWARPDAKPEGGKGPTETALRGWGERIRTSKRQFAEVLGTSAEFSCTAEAI
jgi:hypothetical protein